jgi:hypothetical protein
MRIHGGSSSASPSMRDTERDHRGLGRKFHLQGRCSTVSQFSPIVSYGTPGLTCHIQSWSLVTSGSNAHAVEYSIEAGLTYEDQWGSSDRLHRSDIAFFAGGLGGAFSRCRPYA